MIVSESSSVQRTLAPSGTHIARCVQVIDLGTTEDVSPTYGTKIKHKVRITWELPFELNVFDEKKGEQPFFISQKYTVSLGEQANLRKDLESWRGRPFTVDELKGFDLANILGAPCQVTILHQTGKQSGKLREVVSAITPLAKGMVCPPAISELVSYDVGDGQSEVYQKLPKFLQEDISKCHEWLNLTQGPERSFDSNEPDLDDSDPERIPF